MPSYFERDKRLKSTLAFGESLQTQLSTFVTSKVTGNLALDLRNHISSFPNKFSSNQGFEEIDKRGTNLWNLCIRLRREIESEDSSEVHEVIFLARIFAFLLLDCAHQCGNSTSENLPRLMKTGVKASKSCIDRKDTLLNLKVLSKVSGYQDLLEKSGAKISKNDQDVCGKLLAEYLVLRMALAWQMEQYDIAEHMFHKAINTSQQLEATTTESLADILYEMGKQLLQKKQYPLSIKWLRRALDIINSRHLDELSIDASDLRISIMQSLIKSLLSTEDNNSISESQHLLDVLQADVGDKLVVLLLRLEMFSVASNEQFDCCAYKDILQRIMRIVHLTEPNFKLLMFHIRKLNDKSPSLACQTIEELLNNRILIEGRDEYIEKILVTRIWMAVGHRDSVDESESLDPLLSKLLANNKKSLSPPATLACHTLLWKKVESHYSIAQYDIAEKWCKLAIHPIFESSGELNMARILRKLLLCALAKKETNNAREIFASMTEAAKSEPMSQFLMYKIAIRSGDNDTAVECLQKISLATVKDPTLLYACCLDAQQMNNRSQILHTLEILLDKFKYETPPGVNLPSLIRLTVGLLNGILDESAKADGSVDAKNVEKLCAVFESATSSIRLARDSEKSVNLLWTVDEYEWFSKNSYNLAIKHLSDWHPQHILRILECCIIYIDHYPLHASEKVLHDTSLRKLFCEFCATTTLVALARGEDNIEAQLQDYLKLRKHVNTFDTAFQDRVEKIDQHMQENLKQKFSILLSYDFEAACRLKAWDDLGDIISRADISKSSRVYEIMADCILCADAPTQVTVNTLKEIINGAWKTENLDTLKLAKYMRCLFQIAITENSKIAEQLLDQVCNHCEEALEINQNYPSEELEWIATRAFNHAVDLYCCHDDDGCLVWFGKSLNVAQYCSDNGALKKTLHNKLIQMNLGP